MFGAHRSAAWVLKNNYATIAHLARIYSRIATKPKPPGHPFTSCKSFSVSTMCCCFVLHHTVVYHPPTHILFQTTLQVASLTCLIHTLLTRFHTQVASHISFPVPYCTTKPIFNLWYVKVPVRNLSNMYHMYAFHTHRVPQHRPRLYH